MEKMEYALQILKLQILKLWDMGLFWENKKKNIRLITLEDL